jgi:glycosyltransferase involved in cell wall biosynthesis
MNAELAKRLTDIGYSVTLLTHGSSDNVSYVDPMVGILRWPSPRPNGMADALFLDGLIRQLKPCCVISHFGASALMMIIGAFRRVPTRIRWYHTLSTQIDGDTTKHSKSGQWLERFRSRVVYKLATHIVANSNAAKEDLMKAFHVPESKCQVFWNALRDPFGNTAFANRVRAVESDRNRFICVGRFDLSKGQDNALRAVARVVRQLPEIRLEFIGDGPNQKYCRDLARELGIAAHCTFSGRLAHQDVLLRIASARATIAPSRAEAFGLVNIESMAVGVPVIGSDTGGIREIVRNGVDGLLFPAGDHEILGRGIIELARNEPLRSKMSINSRKRFLDSFELSQAVKTQADWILRAISTSA